MTHQETAALIDVEVFKILNNRRTPNWALLLLVAVFAYFNWQTNPAAIVWLWLLPNCVLMLVRWYWLYPKIDQAKVTTENVGKYHLLYSVNVGIASVFWGMALPVFFVPEQPLLLLVFIFTYFIFLVSATMALTASRLTFLVFWFPLFISLSAVFLFYQNGVYASFAWGFVFFNVFMLYLARVSNIEVNQLIRLQLEQQAMADSLEEKKRIAEKSMEDKNRFLAAASHDLRQPLHSTGLLLSALENHISGDTAKKLLKGVSTSMEALGNSFRSLLDVSKLDAGVVEVSLENISLTELLKNLETEFEARVREKDLSINVSAQELYVFTDQTLLLRVLRNLLSNAVKFTNQGGIELAACRTDSGLIEVAIKDSGVGIPNDELDNIFSEYYQLGNPERDRNRGFGLGLAISKRLCDLLSIPIAVESKSGQGSVFKIALKEGAMSEVKVVKPDVLIDKLEGLTILVIDDDMSILDSMQSLLSEWGCRAICGESQEDAINKLREQNTEPDFIVADYRLRNNLTGTDACLAIEREIGKAIPSIIVTGDTSPSRLKEVVETGYEILHKPVDVNEFKKAMIRLMSS